MRSLDLEPFEYADSKDRVDAIVGALVGGVIFVPLTQWLIARCGWRGAFGWLGVIVLVAAVPPVAKLSGSFHTSQYLTRPAAWRTTFET